MRKHYRQCQNLTYLENLILRQFNKIAKIIQNILL